MTNQSLALRDSENGAAERAEEIFLRSPVSTPAASPKAAPHAYAAEGGGSFAAPTGHALSLVAWMGNCRSVLFVCGRMAGAGAISAMVGLSDDCRCGVYAYSGNRAVI